MLPNRFNTNQLVESRRLRKRSESSQRAEESDSHRSDVAEGAKQEAEGESRETPRLVTDSSADEEQFNQQHYFRSFEEDTMLYLYPKYNDQVDAEVHIRAFLTTWQANHVSQ